MSSTLYRLLYCSRNVMALQTLRASGPVLAPVVHRAAELAAAGPSGRIGGGLNGGMREPADLATAYDPVQHPMDMQPALQAILAVARRRNQADNVTGALLFTASGFAQVLEGSREMVERTFERIGADPRHADVTVLSFTPSERRSFPDWPMGFSGQIKPGIADPLAHLLSDATFAGERATTGGDLLRLLEKVVRRENEWILA